MFCRERKVRGFAEKEKLEVFQRRKSKGFCREGKDKRFCREGKKRGFAEKKKEGVLQRRKGKVIARVWFINLKKWLHPTRHFCSAVCRLVTQ